MTAKIRQPRQDRMVSTAGKGGQKRTGRKGQPEAEHDREKMIDRPGQLQHNRQNRTGRTELAEQNRPNRIGRTEQAEQNRQNRTGRKDRPNRTG
jgi:hypothetical protein